jgi:hypothetical protein
MNADFISFDLSRTQRHAPAAEKSWNKPLKRRNTYIEIREI